MKKIKVCHVITRMIIGGAQENTLFTVEGLAQKQNYEVTLISGNETGPEGDLTEVQAPDAGTVPVGISSGVSYSAAKQSFRAVQAVLTASGSAKRSPLTYKIHSQIPYRMIRESALRRNIHPIFDFIAFFKLYNFFRREKFDIVHTHSSKAGILGRFAAKLAKVPVVIHTIHGLPFHPFQRKSVNLFYKQMERFAANGAHKIITVADAMTQQAVRARIADSKKFVTIRSGMDLEPFLRVDYDKERIRKKFGLNSRDKVIGKIARLFHLKGHEYLIEAASKVVQEFPDAKFLLVGDGVLKEALIQRVNKLGLEKNFIFAGLVRPEEIPELISVMDIVVHCSLREGLAKVLPQALASRKPVISFDLDGAGEVIQNGTNGFLVPPRDTAILTESILKLLRNPELIQRMGKEGLKIVDPYFRKEYMVNQIDQLYKKLFQLNPKWN